MYSTVRGQNNGNYAKYLSPNLPATGANGQCVKFWFLFNGNQAGTLIAFAAIVSILMRQ
jgi:hypothetical protein